MSADQRPEALQSRVNTWMLACFGEEIAMDGQERCHRFLEESLELVQALGCTKAECLQLVDYVYSRQIGEAKQEAGGVMLTFEALCTAWHVDMEAVGEAELARVWTKIDLIRYKQANKPKGSALPTAREGGKR